MINIKELSPQKENRFKYLTKLANKGKLTYKEQIEYNKIAIKKNLNDLETIEFTNISNNMNIK